MARPARVRMRSRKPCVLARRRLFGWKVRLLTAGLHRRSTSSSVRSCRRGRASPSSAPTDHRARSRAGSQPSGGSGTSAAHSTTTVRSPAPPGQTCYWPSRSRGEPLSLRRQLRRFLHRHAAMTCRLSTAAVRFAPRVTRSRVTRRRSNRSDQESFRRPLATQCVDMSVDDPFCWSSAPGRTARRWCRSPGWARRVPAGIAYPAGSVDVVEPPFRG
jgi:hypothetical protein